MSMIRIDMIKVVQKYDKYCKRKTAKGETPMAPEAWLWHTLDTLNVNEIITK